MAKCQPLASTSCRSDHASMRCRHTGGPCKFRQVSVYESSLLAIKQPPFVSPKRLLSFAKPDGHRPLRGKLLRGAQDSAPCRRPAPVPSCSHQAVSLAAPKHALSPHSTSRQKVLQPAAPAKQPAAQSHAPASAARHHSSMGASELEEMARQVGRLELSSALLIERAASLTQQPARHAHPHLTRIPGRRHSDEAGLAGDNPTPVGAWSAQPDGPPAQQHAEASSSKASASAALGGSMHNAQADGQQQASADVAAAAVLEHPVAGSSRGSEQAVAHDASPGLGGSCASSEIRHTESHRSGSVQCADPDVSGGTTHNSAGNSSSGSRSAKTRDADASTSKSRSARQSGQHNSDQAPQLGQDAARRSTPDAVDARVSITARASGAGSAAQSAFASLASARSAGVRGMPMSACASDASAGRTGTGNRGQEGIEECGALASGRVAADERLSASDTERLSGASAAVSSVLASLASGISAGYSPRSTSTFECESPSGRPTYSTLTVEEEGFLGSVLGL